MRRKDRTVEDEMVKVFGEDFISFAMACDCTDEVYAFVKCREYYGHIDRLRHSPAIKSVLSSFDSPCFLSDIEVSNFIESTKPKASVSIFRPGDVVKVTGGPLSNLFGIVVREAGGGRYAVAFRFHTRKFREHILGEHLTLEENLFNFVRQPVVYPTEACHHPESVSDIQERIIHELGIDWEGNRKCQKERGR
jgi:hypothetical protein